MKFRGASTLFVITFRWAHSPFDWLADGSRGEVLFSELNVFSHLLFSSARSVVSAWWGEDVGSQTPSKQPKQSSCKSRELSTWAIEYAGVWGPQMKHLPIVYLSLTGPKHVGPLGSHCLHACSSSSFMFTLFTSLAVSIHLEYINHGNACRSEITYWIRDENKALRRSQTSCSSPMKELSADLWFIRMLTDKMSTGKREAHLEPVA